VRIKDQYYFVIPIFCLIFIPACYQFLTGGPTRLILTYYMGLAVLALLMPLVLKVVDRLHNHGSHQPRAVSPLIGLGYSPDRDGLVEKYPEHRQLIELIFSAIKAGKCLRFRYRKDNGGNSFKLIKPGYVHEHRRHTRHEASLCICGYYAKQRRNVNFSLVRMSEVLVVEQE